MAREPEPVVQLRRALGERLATFRQAAALTQGQLGLRTHYSRTSINKIEHGRQVPDRPFWQTVDDHLQANGALLAGHDEFTQAKREHADREWQAVHAVHRAQAEALRATATLPMVRAEAAGPPTHRGPGLVFPDVAVAASQQAWCTARSWLIQHRTQLAKQAIRLYDPGWHVPRTSTLAAPGWLACQPIPIEALTLDWESRPPHPVLTGREAELRPVLPLRTPRHAFPHYTSAMRYLSPPRLFENRLSYRLLDVSLTPSGQGRLRFGLATFFDKLDVSEALSHEFAVAVMDGAPSWPRLPFRALLSQPFDLSSRTVSSSIATLTVRRNTADGSATFFLLGRDPAKVAVGGGQYGVVPAGEFQPASIAPDSLRADLDLWCNIVREYSEELLGQPEHDGSSGKSLDYDCWPFYRAMQRARESGQLRAYVLGVVLHALGLNAAILTAVVIDDVVFDDVFRDLVNANAEGWVITSLDNEQSVPGLPFTEATVTRLLDHEPLGATSAACLALAWRHRAFLLPDGG